MVTYVVHDAKTGEVLHVHVEPKENASSTEEVVQLAGLTGREGLDVVVAPEGMPLDHAVRVREGRLAASEEGGGSGGAGTGSLTDEPPLQRIVQRLRRSGEPAG
jgi:hypothetical protein